MQTVQKIALLENLLDRVRRNSRHAPARAEAPRAEPVPASAPPRSLPPPLPRIEPVVAAAPPAPAPSEEQVIEISEEMISDAPGDDEGISIVEPEMLVADDEVVLASADAPATEAMEAPPLPIDPLLDVAAPAEASALPDLVEPLPPLEDATRRPLAGAPPNPPAGVSAISAPPPEEAAEWVGEPPPATIRRRSPPPLPSEPSAAPEPAPSSQSETTPLARGDLPLPSALSSESEERGPESGEAETARMSARISRPPPLPQATTPTTATAVAASEPHVVQPAREPTAVGDFIGEVRPVARPTFGEILDGALALGL